MYLNGEYVCVCMCGRKCMEYVCGKMYMVKMVLHFYLSKIVRPVT